MTTIHKYPIYSLNNQIINSHEGAEFLHAGADLSGNPCVWVRADLSKPIKEFTVHCYLTGESIHNDNLKHLSSFTAGELELVYHVFIPTTETP